MKSLQLRRLIVCVLLAGLFQTLLPEPALAWDAVGHKAVARIAWETLTPQTRSRVMSLLRAAPQDSDIHRLMPKGNLPPDVRDREFFMNVSNWADIVREDAFPERREKYHRSTWHYINFFFEQIETGIKERTDLKPGAENAVERLQLLSWRMGDDARSDAEHAIDLAWILHLVGDVHQPLHCSARVTATEPEGDQGGNLFKLELKPEGEFAFNLHSYWDGLVRRAMPRLQDEPDVDYLGRVTKQITNNHPLTAMQMKLKSGEFSVWAQEGYETTKAKLYPASLRRLEIPSSEYQAGAWAAAEPAIALSGYRLAALLEQMFGS